MGASSCRTGCAGSRGVTLVEALLATALLIGVITAASGLYVSAMQAQHGAEAQARVQDMARNVVSQIDQDVKAARSVLESVTIGGTLYQSSSSTLVLKIPALGSGGFVAGGYDTVVYTYDAGSQAVRVVVSPDAQSVRPAENRLIAQSAIQSLSFAYYTIALAEKDPGTSPPGWDDVVLVRTSVTAATVGGGEAYSSSLENEARLRNWEPPAS